MNKKIFFAAVAAAALTACSSEEALESVATKPVVDEAGEIVGAKLASKGITVAVENGEALTRVDANGWQGTDKIALSWVTNGAIAITADQGTALAGSGYSNEIYANIILNTPDHGNSFKTMANIYEGAYFVYSPWEYIKQAGQKVIAPNKDVQEADVNTERYAKLPWISGLKFISAADNNLEEGELTTDFTLSPVANTLRVKTTSDPKVINALGAYSIADMEIYNWTTASFVPSVDLEPAMLPENGGDMDAKVKAIADAGTHVNNIVTEIDPAYGKLDKDKNEFRSFVLPTANTLGAQNVKFYFHVNKGTLKIGEFEINNGSADALNKKTVGKLDLALRTPEALYAKSITQILRNDEGKAAALGLDLNLIPAEFNLTMANAIHNLEEWDIAVEVWEKLGKAGQLEITLAGDVEFDGAINVPTNGVKVSKGTGTLALAAGAHTVVLPENFIGDPADAPDFMINQDATLKVSNNTNETGVNVINFGTVAAATADDPATDDIREDIPGEIVLTTTASQVNMTTNSNNGLITIEQDAAINSNGSEPAKAATVVGAAGTTVKYMIDKHACDDVDLIATVKANAGISTVVIKGQTLTTDTPVPVVEVADKNSEIVASVKNVTTGNVVFADGAELKVTVGKDGTAGIYTIDGATATVSGEGKLTVTGTGTLTKSGSVSVATETTLLVESGVDNQL